MSSSGWFLGWTSVGLLAFFAVTITVIPAPIGAAEAAPAAPPTPEQRAAMLRQWLQASQMQLRHYEYIETTVVTHDGKEASRDEKNCYYDVTGRLQKVPVSHKEDDSGGPPGILPPGRLLKKFGEHKKKEVMERMESAAELIHAYVPPDPDKIQQVVGAGKMSVQLLEPGRRVRLDFKDYLKPGDVLGVELELPTNRLLGIHVSSYLEDAADAVQLATSMNVLPDGAIYMQKSMISAPADKLQVTVTNSGYRRTQ